jgi:2-dehydro-3-deoxyphosphooctonate aldolase (KDO 8-P synthase)
MSKVSSFLHSAHPIIVSGPCSLESESIAIDVAEELVSISKDLEFEYIFKGSFDKANRTSSDSYRGPGLKEGLRILSKVKSITDAAVTTDIHLPHQAQKVAAVVDLIQIPAFLCRQTDLLQAAGASGTPVNIKKGQFMSPASMAFAVEKVRSAGGGTVLLTERGTFFGYGDLVVDFRGIVEMKSTAPVLFDAGHSIQRPSSGNPYSSGDREYIKPLARASAALGVDGLFFETHPHPEKALSDGPNSWPLSEVRELIKDFIDVWTPTRNLPT